MSFDWATLLNPTTLQTAGSIGLSGGFGALIGYGVKLLLKILLKVLAVFTALIAAAILLLNYKYPGIITVAVDFSKVQLALTDLGSWIANMVVQLAGSMSLAIPAVAGMMSFPVGFALGFKKG